MDIQNRLIDKKIKLELTSRAKDFIINSAYDEVYGARPIKRFVSRNIETLLAKSIINEKIKYNSLVTIDVVNNEFIIKGND